MYHWVSQCLPFFFSFSLSFSLFLRFPLLVLSLLYWALPAGSGSFTIGAELNSHLPLSALVSLCTILDLPIAGTAPSLRSRVNQSSSRATLEQILNSVLLTHAERVSGAEGAGEGAAAAATTHTAAAAIAATAATATAAAAAPTSGVSAPPRRVRDFSPALRAAFSKAAAEWEAHIDHLGLTSYPTIPFPLIPPYPTLVGLRVPKLPSLADVSPPPVFFSTLTPAMLPRNEGLSNWYWSCGPGVFPSHPPPTQMYPSSSGGVLLPLEDPPQPLSPPSTVAIVPAAVPISSSPLITKAAVTRLAQHVPRGDLLAICRSASLPVSSEALVSSLLEHIRFDDTAMRRLRRRVLAISHAAVVQRALLPSRSHFYDSSRPRQSGINRNLTHDDLVGLCDLIGHGLTTQSMTSPQRLAYLSDTTRLQALERRLRPLPVLSSAPYISEEEGDEEEEEGEGEEERKREEKVLEEGGDGGSGDASASASASPQLPSESRAGARPPDVFSPEAEARAHVGILFLTTFSDYVAAAPQVAGARAAFLESYNSFGAAGRDLESAQLKASSYLDDLRTRGALRLKSASESAPHKQTGANRDSSGRLLPRKSLASKAPRVSADSRVPASKRKKTHYQGGKKKKKKADGESKRRPPQSTQVSSSYLSTGPGYLPPPSPPVFLPPPPPSGPLSLLSAAASASATNSSLVFRLSVQTGTPVVLPSLSATATEHVPGSLHHLVTHPKHGNHLCFLYPTADAPPWCRASLPITSLLPPLPLSFPPPSCDRCGVSLPGPRFGCVYHPIDLCVPCVVHLLSVGQYQVSVGDPRDYLHPLHDFDPTSLRVLLDAKVYRRWQQVQLETKRVVQGKLEWVIVPTGIVPTFYKVS